MHDKQVHFTAYNSAALPTARELRRKMTKQECHLWYDFLHNYPVKIYRQRSIDRFIVDFYCSAAKLVIEIDGEQHYIDNGPEHDAERTAILEGYGLAVLRFTNLEVDNNFEGVCIAIDNTINARIGVQRND